MDARVQHQPTSPMCTVHSRRPQRAWKRDARRYRTCARISAPRAAECLRFKDLHSMRRNRPTSKTCRLTKRFAWCNWAVALRVTICDQYDDHTASHTESISPMRQPLPTTTTLVSVLRSMSFKCSRSTTKVPSRIALEECAPAATETCGRVAQRWRHAPDGVVGPPLRVSQRKTPFSFFPHGP